jgi:hypothetical protein
MTAWFLNIFINKNGHFCVRFFINLQFVFYFSTIMCYSKIELVCTG